MKCIAAFLMGWSYRKCGGKTNKTSSDSHAGMRSGIADLPLHWGSAPPWLFKRMVRLSGAVAEAVIDEYGQTELLKRLADPYWFQAFGCVLGFDWHSSGLTTTALGALKLGLDAESTGVAVCGGKGAASKKTPTEIAEKADLLGAGCAAEEMVYASRMAAKVDSAAVQDGYELYHHAFIFSEKGLWAVVQQGMNGGRGYARRYHWLSEEVMDFVEEPQKIACDKKEGKVLDMTAKQSNSARKASTELAKENPSHWRRYFDGQTTLNDFGGKRLEMPRHHDVRIASEKTLESLKKAYEMQPEDYEELLAVRGFGASGVRALALLAQLVYGAEASWEDPVKFSFSHGGKDGFPFPVNREDYDNSIEFLRLAVDGAKIEAEEKRRALKRLAAFTA